MTWRVVQCISETRHDIRPGVPRIFLTDLHAYAAVGFPDGRGELLLATENSQPVTGKPA
jgi:hypothetical protein